MIELLQSMGVNIQSTLSRMDWIENHIRKLMDKHPDRAAYLFDCYKYGYTGYYYEMVYENDSLWKSHIEELLQRVVQNENIDLPTNAEILVTFSRISLGVKIDHDFAGAYKNLFVSLLGTDYAEIGITRQEEPYPGAYDKIYAEMKQDILRKSKCSRPAPDPQRWRDVRDE